MRSFLQGLVLVGIFVATNVVGAGVILVLGQIWQRAIPGWGSPWPWFVIGGAGALAAFCFLRGALFYAAGPLLIQWRPGRRGG